MAEEINLNKQPWENLFEKFPFFESYPLYIYLSCFASSKKDEVPWIAFIESKIRQMVILLDNRNEIEYAHPYPNYMTYNEDGHEKYAFFIGIKLESKEVFILKFFR